MQVQFFHRNSDFAQSFLSQDGEVTAQAFTNQGAVCVFNDGNGGFVGFVEFPEDIQLLPSAEDKQPSYKDGMAVIYADGIRKAVVTRTAGPRSRTSNVAHCNMVTV